MQQADRLILSPWVSRAGNATFLTGIVLAVVKLASGASVVTLLTLILFIIGVALMAAPPAGRWLEHRRERAVKELPPTPGVFDDIQHRERCPRDPERIETWTKTREHDGIEVTVGKCNDCGAMAYRHGDIPMKPPSAQARDSDRYQFVREFSTWVRAKRAALPDWPGSEARLRGGLPTTSPAWQNYNQTRLEEQRKARVEYHERFRERVSDLLGEKHGQADDPRTIDDLEALEHLLADRTQGKPALPEAANRRQIFKDLLGHELHVGHELLGSDADMDAALAWGQGRATVLIATGLGEGEAHLFGTNPSALIGQPGEANGEARHYIRCRIRRLEDLIERRLDQLSIRDDFKPEDWAWHAQHLRPELNRLIRRGTEIMSEAEIAGHAADSTIHHPSAHDLARDEEEFRRREAEWIDEVEDVLAEDNDLFQSFADASYIPATGHYAVHNRMEGRLKVLREVRERLNESAAAPVEVDGVRLASEAYRNGAKVRESNVWAEGAPTTPEEFAEAQRRAWARAVAWGIQTWEMLSRHFPGHPERAFFGDLDNHGMGKAGFRMNASAEREAGGTADSYMERKLVILADLLDKENR